MAEDSPNSPDQSLSEAQEATEQTSNNVLERHLPRINCPEHIVRFFIIDIFL